MNYIGQSLIILDHQGARLRWATGQANDLRGYFVYMSEKDEEHFERQMHLPIKSPEWISGPLREDTQYFFYITSVDTSGNESGPSPVISFQFPDTVVDANLNIIHRETLQIASTANIVKKVEQRNFITSFTIGEQP